MLGQPELLNNIYQYIRKQRCLSQFIKCLLASPHSVTSPSICAAASHLLAFVSQRHISQHLCHLVTSPSIYATSSHLLAFVSQRHISQHLCHSVTSPIAFVPPRHISQHLCHCVTSLSICATASLLLACVPQRFFSWHLIFLEFTPHFLPHPSQASVFYISPCVNVLAYVPMSRQRAKGR